MEWNWFELIGIAGTLFVLLSFLMKDMTKVRLINIVGAVFFVVYGLFIGAIATWLLNAVLVVIHVIYLLRERKQNNKSHNNAEIE